MSEPLLAGLRLLVVEDSLYEAMLYEEVLARHGATVVGPASTIPEALELAAANGLDGAILDVSVRGEDTSSIAATLNERSVPFVVVTGYDAYVLDPMLRSGPVLQKPVTAALLASTAAEAFEATRSRSPGGDRR